VVDIHEIDKRLVSAEGTIRWMRWLWMTVGTAVATAIAGALATYFASYAGAAEPPRALLFDTLGTVFDVQGSIERDLGRAMSSRWIAEYGRGILAVHDGHAAYRPADAIALEALSRVQPGIIGSPDTLMRQHWHHARAFPDSKPGIQALRARGFIVAPLTNASFQMVFSLSRQNGIEWDAVFSADLWRTFKPDHRLYREAAGFLNLEPNQIMLVTSHDGYDLEAARRLGFRAAHVNRGTAPSGWADVVVPTIEALAEAIKP
jgi:2-haloacid dehalogenase